MPITASIGTAALTVVESTPGGNGETITNTGLSFVTGLDAIVLSFAASQSPTVNGLDESASITWTLDAGDPSGRTLLGQIGGVTVITLTLTGDVTADGGGDTATPTVTVTSADHFPHQNAPDADSLTISGLIVNATEADGDITTGTVNVTIQDDAPTANDDTAASVVEDAASIGGNVLGNDTPGADGAVLTHVQLPGGSLVAITSGSEGPAGVFSFTVAGIGVYTFQANGAWTFDPVPNQDQDPSNVVASFNYRITDGDGDTDDAVQPITVTDATAAANAAAITLDLDEAALSTAGATGSNPALTTEVDNSPSLSFTAGADNLVSFGFSSDLSGLVTDLNGTGGQDIWWQWVSATQVKGFLDAGMTQLAVTLDLSAPAVIATGTSGTVTVTATLSDNLQHALANGAQVSSLGNILVLATDTDNDVATGQVNLTVKDDAPTANDDTAASVVEDAASIGGNVLGNDTPGADGAVLTHVQLPGGSLVAITSGTEGPAGVFSFTVAGIGVYTFQANGAWTFDPVPNQDQDPSNVVASFNYRITDGDGDTDDAVQPITVTDATAAANAAAITLDLDEAALSTAGATGSNPALTTEVDNSPSLSFTAGADNLVSFGFSTDLSGLVTDLNGTGGQDIWWQWVSATQVKGFLDAGMTQLAVTLDLSAPAVIATGTSGTVTVTATLSDNLQHALANGAQVSSLGNILVLATDTDNDVATGQVNLTVKDDIPTAANDSNLVTESDSVTGNVLLGTVDPGDEDVFGADQPAASAIKIVALSDGDADTGDDYLLGVSANQPDANNVVSITGLFGVLQLNVVTGDYTYTQTVATSSDQVDTFTYSISDADGDRSTATLAISIDDKPRILDGILTTNSNQQSQLITLSFIEKASDDFRDNLHAAAKIYDLSLQGQEGSIVQDVGFGIDGTANYNVTLEASSGTKAILTEFSLEGVLIQGSGNAQLEKNNVSATNSEFDGDHRHHQSQRSTAWGAGAAQDGINGWRSQGNNILSDTSTNTINYYFGADGADTLTGSSGDDVLNGGGGTGHTSRRRRQRRAGL